MKNSTLSIGWKKRMAFNTIAFVITLSAGLSTSSYAAGKSCSCPTGEVPAGPGCAGYGYHHQTCSKNSQGDCTWTCTN